ncbi:MAG: hypothetical protein U9O50_00755 [Acidobacteriota bacterium]|nr:hypothetical protein [Acidobacteriota bacterium]
MNKSFYIRLAWIIHESRLLQTSARPKGKECRHRGKEVHGKRVECYTEGKINVSGRYHRK